MSLAILLVAGFDLALTVLVLLIVSNLAAQVEALASNFSEEVDFLRDQVKDLHDRLMAISEPAAQARIVAQRQSPSGEKPAPKALGVVEPSIFPHRRSGIVVDLPLLPPEPEA